MADTGQLDRLIRNLNERNVRDKITRAALSTLLTNVSDRIFGQGRDANGGDLGTYSPGYMKIRRQRYGRTNQDVNLQATGQMKDDFKLKLGGKNTYGFGFDNATNFAKSRKVERIYNTEIFGLTQTELDNMEKFFEDAARIYLT